MKIGIITFHNSNNYGALLQAIALQTKLRYLGHEVKIINYICENKRDIYKVINISKSKSITQNFRQVIDSPFKLIKKIKADKFIEEKLNLTEDIFTKSDQIKKANLNYDMYICGSDQIWNYENTKFDKTYFLDFVENNKKKMSYAASFGLNEIEDIYKNDYKKLLNEIEYMSVREETGRDIIKSIIDKECEVVLDPTLILSKNEWNKILQDNTINGYKKKFEKYILVYTLHCTKEIVEIAEQLSEKTKLKIVNINANGTKDIIRGLRNNIIPSPLEFVKLINDAEYIITDSFHGTVFSLNLNKEFFVYLKPGLKNHSRIENILGKCGLENRIYRGVKPIENLKNINFNKINSILDNERKSSIKFIEKSLNGEKIDSVELGDIYGSK